MLVRRIQVGAPVSDDSSFAAIQAQAIELEIGDAGRWRQVVDNVDPQFVAVGNWATSTVGNDHYGENYLLHAAQGESPDQITVDNSDPGFSVIGEWAASTQGNGYLGQNYLTRLPGHPQETVLVDDPEAQFVGEWSASSVGNGYLGTGYRSAPAGDGSLRARWPLGAIPTDSYRVYARWVKRGNRANNAPFEIAHADGTDVVRVNQRLDGGTWVLLGTYTLGTDSRIELSNDANGLVIADAIKLIATSTPPNSAIWQADLPHTGDYEVSARWVARPNRATNAPYSIHHADGIATVAVNQSQSGGEWVSLGRYRFSAEALARVSLTDQADKTVVADAVRFVPDPNRPNRATWTLADQGLGKWDVYTGWTARKNRASNAAFRIDSLGSSGLATVNQRVNGKVWNVIGAALLAPDYAGSVEVTDRTDGFVVADAVRIVDRAAEGPVGSRVLDDLQGEASGVWANATGGSGFYDVGVRVAAAGTGSNRFVWPLQTPRDGQYRVYARWTRANNRATNAPFEVTHRDGASVVRVNQRLRGSEWVLLGIFELDAESQVTLTDDADGRVIADAVRIEPAHYPERAP
jgi:hypothetical protein